MPFVDVQDVVGTLVVVEELADPNASPTPFSDEDVPVDVELQVTATLGGFEPAELTIGAGESFRITITNGDEFLQNLRIAGPDGKYRTGDDLTSGEVADVDDTAALVGTIDDPGTYEFRDDFHTNLTGTITIE